MYSPDEHLLRTLKRVRVADFEPIETLRPGLPEELTKIMAKALARKPEDRYQTAEEMRAALEQYRSARCAMPKRALRRWLDRELADQRMKHEQRMTSITATPLPEGTIAYHPELEIVAQKTRRVKRAQASFVEAATEVFFSVDVEGEGAVPGDQSHDQSATDADPVEIDVELPSWEPRRSGMKPRVELEKATTTLVDEVPWWKAYAEMATPDGWADDDAKTRRMASLRDETPRLIDTLRPREHSVTVAPEPPRRRFHRRPVFVVGLLAAAAAVLGVGLHYGVALSGATAADAGILQVRLSGEVAAATVFVDGVERGTAPLTLGTLTPGSHRVRVVANGFAELAEVVEVASGVTTIVAASLSALPDPQPSHIAPPEDDDDISAPPEEPPSPELTEPERARLAAEEARREREARWERLQAYRARQARRLLAEGEREAVVVGVGGRDGRPARVDDVDGPVEEATPRPVRNVGAQEDVVDEAALAAHRPEVQRVVVAERAGDVGLLRE
jgi:hypothetical protein